MASPRRQRENLALLAPIVTGEDSLLSRVAGKIGLPDRTRDEYVSGFLAASRAPPASLRQWLAHPVSEPYRYLWLGGTARGVMGIIGLQGVYDRAAMQRLADTDTLVHFIDPANDISRLFRQYRQRATWLTVVSCGVVLLILMLRYGVVGGLLVIAPAAAAGRPQIASGRQSTRICARATSRPTRSMGGRPGRRVPLRGSQKSWRGSGRHQGGDPGVGLGLVALRRRARCRDGGIRPQQIIEKLQEAKVELGRAGALGRYVAATTSVRNSLESWPAERAVA